MLFRRFIALFAMFLRGLAAGWAVFATLLVAQPAQSQDIRIVQIAPLEGPLKDIGQMFSSGVQLYIDHVNTHGGIAGRKVVLELRDDGYVPERAVQQAKDAVATRDPAALLTFGTNASLKVIDEARTRGWRLAIVPTGTGSRALRTPFDRNVFHLRSSYAREVEQLIRIMASTGSMKWAVVYQDDAFGQDGLLSAQAALQALGLPPPTSVSHPRQQQDLHELVETIRRAEPQAVLLMTNGPAAASFVKQAQGLMGTRLVGISDLDPVELKQRAGDERARGVVLSRALPDPFDVRMPVIQEYSRLVAASGGRVKQNALSLEGFLQAKVLCEGLKRANRPDGPGLIEGLERIGSIDLGGFPIRLGAANHEGSNFVDTLMIARDGRLIH